MEGALILDVVVLQCSAVLELFTSEDEALLVGRDAFLVLNLGLDVLDGVGGFDVEGDGLACESLDEDLHATAESQDEMESRFFLDIIILESPAIFKLFAGENESLLIWGNTFFVLDLCLHIFNCVRWLNIQGDGLASESLHKDLHATTEAEDEMECGFLLDVVVLEGAAIFELFACEDQSLLIWRDAFFVLNFSFEVLDGVRWLNVKSDSFACQSLNEDLHST